MLKRQKARYKPFSLLISTGIISTYAQHLFFLSLSPFLFEGGV